MFLFICFSLISSAICFGFSNSHFFMDKKAALATGAINVDQDGIVNNRRILKLKRSRLKSGVPLTKRMLIGPYRKTSFTCTPTGSDRRTRTCET